jgi:hypothetical protein
MRRQKKRTYIAKKALPILVCATRDNPAAAAIIIAGCNFENNQDREIRRMKNFDCYQKENNEDFQYRKLHNLHRHLEIPAIIYKILTTI